MTKVEVNPVPELVKEKLKAIRVLYWELENVRYRMGTHGEKGLYRKYKSLIKEIGNSKDNFAKTINDWQLVYTGDTNGYYVKLVNKV
jgi:hypothetical protein